MFLTTIPEPLGNYEKKAPPVLINACLQKLNAIHIPNPQTMLGKNTALLFLSVIKAYMKDATLFCHQEQQ